MPACQHLLFKEACMKKYTLLFPLLLGALSLNVHANTYTGITLGAQRISANTSTFRGLRPGLFIGYGEMIDTDTYLAGELSGTIVHATSDTYVNRNQSVRMSPEFNLSIIPGMVFAQDTMGYFRLAFETSYTNATGHWDKGVMLGLGVEYSLTPCWGLRGEYDYTFYRRVNVGVPRSNMLAVSVKYTYDV
jgi:opacity protein-like surface antigen